MASRYIGLDVGTHAVTAAEISVGRDGETTLVKMGQVALPQGAVDAGEVADPGAVASAIRKLWKNTRFGSKKVHLGLGNQRVVVRPTELPDMGEDELRSAIEFQADELIPLPLSDAILDFQVLERFTSEDGDPMVRVLVVAAQRDMVASLLAAVDEAGLDPVIVDIDPFAMLRALGDPARAEGASEALVSVGAGVTNIVVHDAGIPKFIRIIPQGGDDATHALADQLEISFDEAEALKRQVAAGADVPDADRASAIIDESLNPLVEDIQGSLDYHVAQTGGEPLRRVQLTGGGSRVPRLAERLQALLGVEVIRAHPLERLRVGDTGLTPEQLNEAEDLIAVPVGLALAGRPGPEGIRRLSLLPPEIGQERAARRQVLLTGLVILVIAALLGLLWFQRQSDVNDAEDEAEAAEAETTALEARAAALGSIQSLSTEVDSRKDLVRTALANDVAWAKLLQELATVMPDDVWWSTFTGTAPQETSVGTVVVAGNGADHTSSARWLLRVDPLESTAELLLASSNITSDPTGLADQEATFNSDMDLTDRAQSTRIDTYIFDNVVNALGPEEGAAAVDDPASEEGAGQ